MQSRLYYFKWTKPCPTLLRSLLILLDTLSELSNRKFCAAISKKSSTKPYDPRHWITDLFLDPAYRISGQSAAVDMSIMRTPGPYPYKYCLPMDSGNY